MRAQVEKADAVQAARVAAGERASAKGRIEELERELSQCETKSEQLVRENSTLAEQVRTLSPEGGVSHHGPERLADPFDVEPDEQGDDVLVPQVTWKSDTQTATSSPTTQQCRSQRSTFCLPSPRHLDPNHPTIACPGLREVLDRRGRHSPDRIQRQWDYSKKAGRD